MAKYYKKAMDNVISSFEATHKKLLKTVEDGSDPTPADLYKLDKYWQMQGQLKKELELLGNKEIEALSKTFTNAYKDVYDNLAIQGGAMFAEVDKKAAEQIIKQVWCADGKSWSSRVWTNTDKLQQMLNDQLLDCVITGKKTTELKNLLQERFQVSYSAADSLVRTEIAHIQTQAARDRYIDAGVAEVEVWADKDERRCDVCGKLHEKRFKVTEKIPVPAHPRCRCTIIPVIEKNTQLQKNTGGLVAEFDKFVPCLEDSKTGEILDTMVTKLDTKALRGYNKANGWYVNWQLLSKQKDTNVYALKVKGSEAVEGLIALKKDDVHQAIYLQWMVAAPHNNKHKSLTGGKKYEGVGGHLLAIAADKSKEFGYNGCIYGYAMNNEVYQYYINKTGAIPVRYEVNKVIWLDDAANNILREYNYEYE